MSYFTPKLGDLGLNLIDSSEINMGDSQVAKADNIDIDPGGRAICRFGYTELGSATGVGAGAIQGLETYYKTTGTEKDELIVFTNGQDGSSNDIFAYTDATPTWSSTPLGTIGTRGARVRGAVINDELVFGNAQNAGASALKKYDGTSISNVTTSPPRASIFEVYGAADAVNLYASGGIAGNRSSVWRSIPEDGDDFGGAGSDTISVSLNDGSIMTGLKAFGNNLVAFKEKTKRIIANLFDDTEAVVASQVLPFVDKSGGCIAPDSIIQVYNDLYHLAELDKGIQKFGLSQLSGGTTHPLSGLLSYPVQPLVETINRPYADGVVAEFFQNRAIFCAPFGVSTTNNAALVYQWMASQGSGNVWTTYSNFNANCFAIFRNADKEDRLVFGSPNQPKIYTLTENFSDNGSGYSRSLKTKKYHFGMPHQVKLYKYIDISGLIALNTTLTIYITVNERTQTVTLNRNNVDFIIDPDTEGYMGENYLGTNYFGGDVGAPEVPMFPFKRRIFIEQAYRRGTTIQVEFTNDGNGQGWAIDFPYISVEWEPFSKTATS